VAETWSLTIEGLFYLQCLQVADARAQAIAGRRGTDVALASWMIVVLSRERQFAIDHEKVVGPMNFLDGDAVGFGVQDSNQLSTEA
jgi:hypothetical protein